MRNFFLFLLEIFQIVILALVIVIPIRYFIFQPFIVKGQSMEPNFENGDYLIVDEISMRIKDFERGDVVVFKNPLNPSQRFIKRIIGLPGETVKIEKGNITIIKGNENFVLKEPYLQHSWESRDQEVRLGTDEYFVLGDNRNFSFDSREFGPIHKKYIIGKVILRLWPFSLEKIRIETPTY